MISKEVLLFWGILAGAGFAGWQLFLKRFVSAAARERRRRRRNYGPTSSRRSGPRVKLAARINRS